LIRSGRKSRLKASDCARLGSARLSTTDPYLFEEDEAEAFERVRRSARTTRYGQDGYAYARLAAGTLDLVVECGLKPHDYNALIPVVRASGGVIGDWTGGEDFSAGNIIAAATRELYEEAVSLMTGAA
jgi:myo-inositol-1(or 4)-monophosphatase